MAGNEPRMMRDVLPVTQPERNDGIRELVILSGKGGTGKTSVAAAFTLLAGDSVIADCDVDAPDLHLILSPRIAQRHVFHSGREAVIRQKDCMGCGECRALCRFDAVRLEDGESGPFFSIDPLSCEGCGVCVRFCPVGAIEFPERKCGEWMVSDTRCGPMVHAQLDVAGENSGKLVSMVRQEARRIAQQEKRSLIIVDGPPGMGCPVIASVTGASLALVVAEPTVSGEHDLARTLSLIRHFGIPAAVCVNKWDINPEMTERIETSAHAGGALVAGRIRYDRGVTLAQMQARSVLETGAPCAQDMVSCWNRLGLQEA